MNDTSLKDNHRIPVVVGVTGHREIREQDRAAIAASVRAELEKLRSLCPHSSLVMLNSLAEGGDLLCADAAEELGIPLIAALPREREDYERDFSAEALERFSHHCARASQVFTAPPTETIPAGGVSRNYQFRQAGIYVASHCHVLLALWDGAEGTASACGTAEAVDFALHGSYEPASGVVLRSESNEAVIHVFTPRGSHTEEAPGTVHVLGNREAVESVLCMTDNFNLNAERAVPDVRPSAFAGYGGDPVLKRAETVSAAAGALSRQAARRYRCVLALLAVFSAVLTFAFLLYDEVQAIWMILVCGVMLLAAFGCSRWAARSDCHRQYIEYRMLAECLRVQTYLRYAGSRVQSAELLSWTQQDETAWVLDALCVLTIGETPAVRHDIRGCWVDDQREYHAHAAKSAGRKLRGSERIVQLALILSVSLYLGAVVYEFLCGGLILAPSVHVADVELWRTVLKIILGTISAVTLFVSSYYGRLSFPRILSDHRKMERFYRVMADRLERYGQTEELLTVLAREELIENSNWCSYQRDNKPDMII